ncbi:MAG: two-component system response regulator [Geobacter sp.]|nr:MAG: two-component system response regulator [Geobacter sp.]
MNCPKSLPILLVDDEAPILKASALMLQSRGFTNIISVQDSREVMALLASQPIAVVVVDMFMPGITGRELLTRINGMYPEVLVIIMTSLEETQTVVDCMRNGAFDYLVKPVDPDRLEATLTRALDVRALSREVTTLKEYLLTDCLANPEAFDEIKTQDKRMRAIFQYVEVIAPSRQPVLITGETGVGKDLLCKAIHSVCRCKGELVAVNVAGLDDAMFSDTLFGHKRGAYTGADQARDGLISRAAGGTIFLDEIGDLSDSSQIKLLRLLQEHEYYPVGSDTPRKSDARVVVATNKSLRNLIADGKFRNDLYYRLCTHQIEIPPLRDRPDDIMFLVDHFLQKAADTLGRNRLYAPPELTKIICGYSFPGNVRELEAMVYDAVVRASAGEMPLDGFKEAVGNLSLHEGPHASLNAENRRQLLHSIFGKFPTIRQMEDLMIQEAIKEAKGNQGAAANILGITRQTLNKRLGEIRKEEGTR